MLTARDENIIPSRCRLCQLLTMWAFVPNATQRLLGCRRKTYPQLPRPLQTSPRPLALVVKETFHSGISLLASVCWTYDGQSLCACLHKREPLSTNILQFSCTDFLQSGRPSPSWQPWIWALTGDGIDLVPTHRKD